MQCSCPGIAIFPTSLRGIGATSLLSRDTMAFAIMQDGEASIKSRVLISRMEQRVIHSSCSLANTSIICLHRVLINFFHFPSIFFMMSSISLCHLEDDDCRIAFSVMCEVVGEKNHRLEKELECAKVEIASLRALIDKKDVLIEKKDIIINNKEEHIQELTEQVGLLEEGVLHLNDDLDDAEHQMRRGRHRRMRETFYRRYCGELEKWIQRKFEWAIDLTFISRSFRSYFEENWNLDNFELDVNMRQAL